MGKKAVAWTIAIVALAAAGYYAYPHLAGSGTATEQKAGAPQGGRGGQATSVLAAAATIADFPVNRYAIGFISSPSVVNVNARVASQIVNIPVKDGQMVKAGDILFQLDDRALKAAVDKDKAELDKSMAVLASANADLDRAKNLMNRQAGTQQAYDQALAAQKSAQATIEANKATLEADQVQLSFTTIKAPIAGRLGAINVTYGDLVSTGASGSANSLPLVTITQVDPLRVSFNLPESDLPLLRQQMISAVASDVTLRKDGSADPIGTGKLDFIDSAVDTASGTILARATVPNGEGKLWPGQYVNVALNAGLLPQMVSVPTVAVQPSQKGSFVFVVGADNKVEMRPVKIALTHGSNTAIEEGLKEGEKVVTEGQLRLKQGSPVRIMQPGDKQAGSDKVAEGAPANGALKQ